MSENPATDITSFQGLIQALQNYWSEQGCVILQPLDMEVGAGTFHRNPERQGGYPDTIQSVVMLTPQR